MDKLTSILSELKSTVNSPKTAIVNHFDDIKNQFEQHRNSTLLYF